MSPPAWNDLRNQLVGSETYARRALSEIERIIVHHSAVDVDSTARQVAEYHVNVLGWPGIGYNFLVHYDGEIDYVGNIQTVRYNVAGRNREVVGICLLGDFTSQWPRPEQLYSAAHLVRYLQFLLPGRETVGHREIALPASPTSCPGKTWPEWRQNILSGGLK